MTDYINLIKSLESPYRFNHSLNVAKSAVILAKKYNADVSKAYTCGILHDIAKDIDKSEQLDLISEAGICLTPVELVNPKLWHAKAGAAYLKTKLNITDEDMLNAVSFHTTARANMSMLEKVIYIADYISDERNYNGVDEMREAAEISLEQAMFVALKFTLSDLSQKSVVISPDSVDAYNDITINYFLKGKII